MGKSFIGKRVRVQIGGEPPKDDKNTIVGEDLTVHLPSEVLDKYSNITGEKVELLVGHDIDATVNNIMSAIKNSDEEKRAQIVTICEEILAEKDKTTKVNRVAVLITLGSEMASIAKFILQLKSMVGM